MTNVPSTDLEAANTGTIFALREVLQALLITHPNKGELLIALKKQGEEAIAYLLASRAPDVAVEAFRETWNGVVPFPADEQDSLDPRL